MNNIINNNQYKIKNIRYSNKNVIKEIDLKIKEELLKMEHINKV